MPQAATFTPATATITAINIDADGKITVWFGSEGNVYNSIEQMTETLVQLQTSDTARLLLIAWWIARQPAGGNPNLVIGKTLTFDLSAANPIRVQ